MQYFEFMGCKVMDLIKKIKN